MPDYFRTFGKDFEEAELLPILQSYIQTAVYPKWRGRQMKSRKVLALGENYYWGEEVPKMEIPEMFAEGYDCGLVNIYKGGQRISAHKDTQEGMDIEFNEGFILMWNFGLTEDLELIPEGEQVGAIDIKEPTDPTKNCRYAINSGVGVLTKAYECEHSAYTTKSKRFAYRVNITLRKKK